MSNLLSDNFTLYTPLILSDEEWASGAFGKAHVVDTPNVSHTCFLRRLKN